MLFVALSFYLVACGGGGGDVSDTGAGTLKTSHAKAVPGSFITVEDDSIESTAALDVTFNDASGYEVTLTTTPVADNRARIPIPYYFNTDTGYPEAGEVTISLPNGRQADLQIEPLPDLSEFEPGKIIGGYLEAIAENFEETLAGLDDFAFEYDHDVADLKTQLQLEIDALNDALDELDSQGTYSVSYLMSGTTTLSPTDLHIVEQILYAMISGVADELDDISESPAEDDEIEIIEISGYADDLPKWAREKIKKMVHQTSKPSLDGIKTVSDCIKWLLDNPGKNIPGSGDAKKAIGLGEGLLDTAIKGATNEAVNKLDDEFGDSYQPGEGLLDAGAEKLDQTIEEMTPSWVERLGSLWGEIQAAERAWQKKHCAQEPLTEELRNTCYEWGLHLPIFSTIKWAKFYPDEVITAEPVKLGFRMDGYKGSNIANVNTITIDWDIHSPGKDTIIRYGRGYPDAYGNEIPFGIRNIKHAYVLPGFEDKTYTARITIEGDNDPDKAHVHRYETSVRVKADIEPLEVTFLQGDGLLEVNERGYWRVAVDGGVSPFDTDIYWDDGKSQHRKGSHLRRYRGPHSYTSANQYTIRFQVEDARGVSAFDEFVVEVVNGLDGGDGDDSGDGDKCSTPPSTAAGEAGRYYRVKWYYGPMPNTSRCYTAAQIDAFKGTENTIHPDEARGDCIVCSQGFTLGTIDGVETCYECLDGTGIVDGCCQ